MRKLIIVNKTKFKPGLKTEKYIYVYKFIIKCRGKKYCVGCYSYFQS